MLRCVALGRSWHLADMEIAPLENLPFRGRARIELSDDREFIRKA